MNIEQAIRNARVLACALILAVTGCATLGVGERDPRPYDARADARAAIAAALADNPGRKPVLLTFGANWCSDSRALEKHYRSQILSGMLSDFRVVHIDVGMNHRNTDLVEQYGNPTDKGIPSVVVLDADGNTLYVNHGSLSNAAVMSVPAVEAFFAALPRDRQAAESGTASSR